MAVTTKAGKPCDEMISIYGTSEPSMDERMCKKCNFVKPGRTHHCSVCKSCVMKMDHHCPWLANCVGYKNYRYFVCFLIWVTITTSYVALVCSPTVLAPGSILIPDENFSLKETVYNAIMKPKLPSINLYASVSSFVDWESKALDREDKERKNILNDFKFASSSQDNAAPDVQRRLQHVGGEEVPINRFTESAKKMAGATGVLKGSQRHHVTGLTHTHLHNPTWYYRFTHWQEYLPPEDFSLFITFVLSVGVTCGTGILMWFHLFLITKGMSTIEYFESQMVIARLKREGRVYMNPYDRGSLLKNFQQVFGEVPWYMMILPSTRQPPPYKLCLARPVFPCNHRRDMA